MNDRTNFRPFNENIVHEMAKFGRELALRMNVHYFPEIGDTAS